MKEIVTYLNFDGSCREAMSFYAKNLGADLQLLQFSDVPGDFPPESKDKIMHARLSKGKTLLMGSDLLPGMALKRGNDLWISMSCESLEEIEGLFPAFAEGGSVMMPLHDAFWGARFGVLRDRFGVGWMFNFELPKQG
jgi:PhnB protein